MRQFVRWKSRSKCNIIYVVPAASWTGHAASRVNPLLKEKKMNRSLLIAALLAVGLTACGEKPAPAPAPKATPAPAPAAAPAPAPAPAAAPAPGPAPAAAPAPAPAGAPGDAAGK